jgi:hypothetical protein
MATKLPFGKRRPDSDTRRVGAILGTAYLAIAAWIVAASITLGAEFTRSRPADQASTRPADQASPAPVNEQSPRPASKESPRPASEESPRPASDESSTSADQASWPRPADQASPNAAIAGAFTGAWVNGAPVYRLPSISVTGHRDAEFAARQPRDEDRLRARQIRTSAPVRPCLHVAESTLVSNSLRVM